MVISLLGYMGCGKSHVSRLLSKKVNYKLIDLDQRIALKEKKNIQKIFNQDGEIYFRKAEREVLEEILATENNCVLSLGGGTPVYYNNMEIINYGSTSFFLQTSVGELSNRLLKNKNKRPLIANIADENLPEFIAKHLFERNSFYNKAQFTINTNNKSPEDIVAEINSMINLI